MREFTEGENYVFNEDGMYCEVTLIEDLSDDEWKKFKLKVVKILGNPGGLLGKMKDPEIDTEFTVSSLKGGGYAGYGNWYLRELGSTPYG